MTYGALAMTVGAILFREHTATARSGDRDEDFRTGVLRANRGVRRPVPGDPAAIEDDYYRFLNAPSD